jgi:hypothetical protein
MKYEAGSMYSEYSTDQICMEHIIDVISPILPTPTVVVSGTTSEALALRSQIPNLQDSKTYYYKGKQLAHPPECAPIKSNLH